MQNPKQQRRTALTCQVARLDARIAQLQRSSDRVALLRLIVFVSGVLISGALWLANSNLAGIALLITLLVFGGIVAVHRRFKESIRRFRGWKTIKREHIARSALDWEHIPLLDPTPPDAAHPFAADLDLTGERSIQHLLDTAVSLEGSRRLKAWLLNTAPDVDAIRIRQALVHELAPRALFRDKVTLNARRAAKDLNLLWEGQSLLKWLQSASGDFPKGVVYLLSGLALVNIGLLVLGNFVTVPSLLQLISFAVYVGVYLTQRSQVDELFEDALALGTALAKLQSVFGYLETCGYAQRPHLETLCAPFLDPTARPSVQIRQVTRILSAASIQGNPILWIALNAILPWDMLVAWKLRDAKIRLAALLPGWLDTWHELEALGALANFAYLNPGCAFPTIRDNRQSGRDSLPIFEGRDLGHPLIPDDQRVGNDFHIDHLGSLILITGSNMAGKSSFLRTLGVNLSLAYAGCVVNAAGARYSALSAVYVYQDQRFGNRWLLLFLRGSAPPESAAQCVGRRGRDSALLPDR